MATPQTEDGFTRIANELMEALARSCPGHTEGQVLLAVIRKTYGWHKKEDKISISMLSEMTGKSKRMVIYAIQNLEAKNMVHVKRETRGLIKETNTISFNKNYEEWKSEEKSKNYKETINKQKGKYHRVVQENKDLNILHKGSARKQEKVVQENTLDNQFLAHTKETTTKDITKEITTNVVTGFGNPDVNVVKAYFLEKMRIPKEDCTKKQSSQYWYTLLRESGRGVEGVKMLIDIASEDDFYRNNITSSMDLFYKRIKLMARRRSNVPQVSVMGEKGETYETMATNYRDKGLLLN